MTSSLHTPLRFCALRTLLVAACATASLWLSAAEFGSSDFVPSPEKPAGFRGDGSGRWPGVTNPVTSWKEGVWDATDTGIAWRTPMPKTTLAGPILVGDKLFTLAEPHTLLCLDAKTGRVLWQRENPPWEGMPADKAARAKELFHQVTATIRDFRLTLREYRWLRGWGPAAQWDNNLITKPATDSLVSDDPRIPPRLAELERHWQERRYSNATTRSTDEPVPVNPAHAGHTAGIYDEKTPEHRAFYAGPLRELFLDYGIAPLASDTGLQPVQHGQAQATPVSDGKYIYVTFGYGQTVCYDLEGNRRWITWRPHVINSNVRKNFGSSSVWNDHLGHYFGLLESSPILRKGVLYTTLGGAIRALDAATGKLLWETPYADISLAWGTPAFVTLADGQEVLFCPQGFVLRPSDGKILTPQINPYKLFDVPSGNWHCVLTGSPAVNKDRVYMAWAFGVVGYQIVPAGAEAVELKRLWLAVRPAQRDPKDDYQEKDYQKVVTRPPNGSPETMYTTSTLYDPDRNRVYVGTHLAKCVYAFDADTGTVLGEYRHRYGPAISSYGASVAILGRRWLSYPIAGGTVSYFDLDAPFDQKPVGFGVLVTQQNRDWNSSMKEYPKDPNHRRVPWEIMRQRWIDAEWSRQFWVTWWTGQNGLQFYGEPLYVGDRVYIRASDALYCFQTGAKDTQPPTAPADPNLRWDQTDDGSYRRLQLRWTESTDNVRIRLYRVFADGQEVRALAYPLAEFKPGELKPGAKLTIVAEDGSGNLSHSSPPVVVPDEH